MNAFIDVEPIEQVLELVKYTGSLLADQPTFVVDCEAKISAGQVTEVLDTLITNSHAYYKGTKDIESIFNSMSRLLCAPDHYTTGLVKTLADALASEAITGHEAARMKVLCNLFNYLDRTSSSRFDLYYNLLILAGRTGAIDALKSQFSQIDQWVVDWSISTEQARTLYRTVHNVCGTAGEGSLGCTFLMKLLQTYDSDEGDLTDDVQALAAQLIKQTLGDPNVYDVEELFSLKAVTQLESQPVHKLLTVFMKASLADFRAWTAEYPEGLAGFGLDEVELTRKARLLSLAKLAAEQRVVDFAKICEELDIPETEVEVWIIDVIRVGLIEAKVDQVKSQLLVSRSTHGTFETEAWTELKDQLTDWRTNIVSCQKVLHEVMRRMTALPAASK